ncbi:hypothetical protein CLAFUW4_09134 [Fulvia fulva]|nr:hypothetical protein CLAFUR4_09140 [Fulvia fulva]KAK4614383.1 hypothetical protein CLAFUR0_09132 [Fulvia fulva]WPV20192.1 hypothetical protein CLAFUW4_09134 [Fulvia fulva]WPV34795.1 hypothetical protein CLAFUW7_09135 [Fulvia fulva]
MVAIKNLVLFVAAATALPAAIEKRDAFSSLQDDLAKIHDKAGKIVKDMPSCDGVFCAMRLKGQADDIKDLLEDATKDITSASKSFSDSESKKIVTMLDGTLEKDITGVLHGVERHEKLKGLKGRVKPYLEDLKVDIKDFGDALTKKVSKDSVEKVRKEVDEMEAEAEQAIKVYSE